MPPLNEAVDIVIGELLSDIAEGVVAPEVDLQDLMDDVVRPHVTAETAAGEYRHAGESRSLQHLTGAYWSSDELRGRRPTLDGNSARRPSSCSTSKSSALHRLVAAAGEAGLDALSCDWRSRRIRSRAS